MTEVLPMYCPHCGYYHGRGTTVETRDVGKARPEVKCVNCGWWF